MMRHCAFVVVLCASVSAADDKSKDGEEKESPPRADLLRFYDKKLNEHVYSYGEGEPQSWRERDEFQGETVVGQVALTKEKGTTPLYRARRKDGRHYFYLIKPTAMKDYTLEEFHVYVWTKPGDGRIAIHGCVQPDGLDMLLDSDVKIINDFNANTLKGIGLKRRTFMRVFYVYPSESEEKPKADAKAKSDDKSKTDAAEADKK